MKLRRTMMFVPGNNPGMLTNAGIYGADTLMLDLEDSVAITEKDSARHLVYEALKTIDYPCEVGVRINHVNTPFGYDDLEAVLAVKPDFIRLPKTEAADEICEIDSIITKAEERHGFPAGSIKIVAAIETALGLLNAHSIAGASPRMTAIAIGGEDFRADLKTSKTEHGNELFLARAMLVLAARAAKIDVIDSVYSDVSNDEGFITETIRIKEMGFDGKSVINPRQIKLVNQVFTPTAKEIEKAQMVVDAYEESLARKFGVVSLNGKMIDAPVVTRAQRILAYANAVGARRRREEL